MNSEFTRLAYNIQEAAQMLGISRSQLCKLIAQGRLTKIRIGERGVRITRDELQRFLADSVDEKDVHPSPSPPDPGNRARNYEAGS